MRKKDDEFLLDDKPLLFPRIVKQMGETRIFQPSFPKRWPPWLFSSIQNPKVTPSKVPTAANLMGFDWDALEASERDEGGLRWLR